MTEHQVILLDPALGNSDVGLLVDPGLLVTGHPDSVAVDADGWVALRSLRQAEERPFHWREVPAHG